MNATTMLMLTRPVGWEFPALTRNANVQRILRVDPDTPDAVSHSGDKGVLISDA